ncbi:putative mucoidy inhibitor-like protein [Phaeoacremonium minimum UCRPA7]|uniref:Putative mucoidy inhibitor-like protein n=1 Tax=Phaeoacremonium minimum (strain UCR-PA7) TaxID=1286976 RepID=R8BX50_PHAM7|nr:putative mucoidy inhibitor-like protein [Phaeoacremonium minimum UCRPA7]EOO03864.1 putative mucoidy inhibitor-like protein [Phaeoacremonium minimum UCRPA7]
MDIIHKHEYRVRDLTTRSVTLFPTRAQVVRDIKDVPLKPGANQITILGLTPTIDEDSIKVEGTGSAVISDITVELLPNRDIFQEIYPDSDSEDDSEEESDSDKEDNIEDSAELKAIRDKLTALRDDLKRAKETISSAESRLKFLDSYGKMLDKKKGVNISEGVDTYRTERQKVFDDHMEGLVRERDLDKDITELVKEERRLLKARLKEQQKAEKAKAKAQKAKDKEKEKKRRREEERQKEKTRIRKEREQFWPRSCYSVRITLDAASFTPMSSRRSSFASVTDLVKVPEPDKSNGEPAVVDEASPTCDLSLSYVTSSAFWSPSYDLQLSTTTNTGLLFFDAQLTNMTCETWSNCKVILSTSQTSFSGLNDAIPTLEPWRVKLGGKNLPSMSSSMSNNVMVSRQELAEKSKWTQNQAQAFAHKPRAQLFGVSKEGNQEYSKKHSSMLASIPPPPPPIAPAPAAGGLFGAPQASSAFGATRGEAAGGGGALFGSNTNNMVPLPAALQRRVRLPAPHQATDERLAEQVEMVFRDEAPGGAVSDDDGETMLEPTPELAFQESAMEETGLTTTYDLPGLKTLSPTPTASKQRVARISFSSVTFSHTIIAKYKPVAFLKAKLRNASKLTLLKGPAGLTLDGSFMGRSSLPRCSAGDTFTMSLGVDPAIKVTYPKPDVKRSTTGLFSKEDSSIYTRTATITNTRATAGKPVNLLVLDQVPVSEDERLRIDIIHPRGMTVGGQAVNTGVAGRESAGGKEDKAWGKATAALKKGGEISWDVSLNAGKSVKLNLEYEVALPTGDHVIQV